MQTHIQLLMRSAFLQRVAERMQIETVPPPPRLEDRFSRLRQRVRPESRELLARKEEALNAALSSISVRPINGTRLVELTCDSTHPDIASEFINTTAQEFIQETNQARTQTAQKTMDWLAVQVEETKLKMKESEERLQQFVRNSGNEFANHDTTLDTTKLKQLQGEVAAMQADRIAKQTRYESVSKASETLLPELLGDVPLGIMQGELAALRRDKAGLETTLTPSHNKVRRLNAQIEAIEVDVKRKIEAGVVRIRSEYESALRRERLLSSAYNSQTDRVGAKIPRASEYDALRREVDTLRQIYQSLVLQTNEASLGTSLPTSPVRLVEPSVPAIRPYAPKPVLNIIFGSVFGLMLTGGIAFLRERLDRRVRAPGAVRDFVNVPELAVIPSAMVDMPRRRFSALRRGSNDKELSIDLLNPLKAALAGRGGSLLAESFRGALASLMRGTHGRSTPRVILITSAAPGEGKTTVVANLGVALAEAGEKVLLIDADLRRPHLHRLFNVDASRGLCDVLNEESPFEDATIDGFVSKTDVPGLSILPSGKTPDKLSKVLYSPRVEKLIERFRGQYTRILIDTPPMLNLADARVLALLTDGVIVIVRSGVTDHENVTSVFTQLSNDGVPLLGTILNDWDPGKRLRQQYYQYLQQPDRLKISTSDDSRY